MGGESTSPTVNTPTVSPVASVVQAGEFLEKLTLDHLELHRLNNWQIQHFVQDLEDDYLAAVRLRERVVENLRDDLENPSGYYPTEVGQGRLSDEREDIANVRRLHRPAELAGQLEDKVLGELDRVQALFKTTADILNGANPDGIKIRADISKLDAMIAPLTEQLDILAQKMVDYPYDYIPDEAQRNGIASIMDGSEFTPPSIDPYGQTPYDSWRAALLDARYRHPYYAFLNVSGGIRQEYLQISRQYPSDYKRYQRLLGGYNDTNEPIDWGNIASTALWVIATEVAFHAAAVALAPVTGGIGTAILYAARTAERAGRLGRFAATGINGAVIVGRWMVKVDQKLWEPFEKAFAAAKTRLANLRNIRGGKPAGQIDGPSTKPRSGACAGFKCA